MQHLKKYLQHFFEAYYCISKQEKLRTQWPIALVHKKTATSLKTKAYHDSCLHKKFILCAEPAV